MGKINIYLIDIKSEIKKLLIEYLKKDNNNLKTSYYEVNFKMDNDSKKTIEIIDIKVIDEILPYLDSVFKNRDIKKTLLDDKTTLEMIKLLYESIKSGKVKIKNNINIENEDKKDIFNIFYDDELEGIREEKTVNNNVTYKNYNYSDYNYMVYKKYIKSYFKNGKKDSKKI